MTPDDLLADLEAAGLTLQRDGERLLVSPAALITPDLAARIREGKAGLLTALAVRAAQSATPAIPWEDAHPGEAVRLVERVVLVWPDGEAMAFDPEFVDWWERFNAEASLLREIAERKTTRKKAAQ